MATTTKKITLTGGWDKVALEGAATVEIGTSGYYTIDPPAATVALSRGLSLNAMTEVSMLLKASEALFVKGDAGAILIVAAEQHA
jgi:hypothetical protein